MDITQLILDDHHEQRRRFAVVEQMDLASVAGARRGLARWQCSLKSTPAAEEEIFYPELVKLALGPQPLARAEPETAARDLRPQRDTGRHRGRSPAPGGQRRLARGHRRGQRCQRRSHGRGGARGPH